MNDTTKTTLAAAALLAGLMATCGASAQSTWTLLNANCTPSFGSNLTTARCVQDGTTATVTAWAAATTGSTFAAATFTEWDGSGIGVKSGSEIGTTSPYHAIDNSGTIEAVAVQFSNATMLQSLAIGWRGAEPYKTPDADLSVYRWTGVGAPNATTPNGLIGNGWALVTNLDLDTSMRGAIAGPNNGYSSWWLISSYFGPAYTSADGKTSLDTGNDFFKLLSFTGTAQPASPPAAVPEPGSLALAGLALTGLFAAQRRRARRG